MIRVLDLPGIPEIEARVQLNALTASRQDRQLDEMVEDFISKVLDVHDEPRQMIWEAIYFGLQAHGVDEGEALFAANHRKRLTADDWWKDGWDVHGQDGQVLMCYNLIEEPLICMAGGLTRRSKIELEQMIWKSKREAERQVSPRERASNQNFLELGQSRRKRA